ncbi:hypothetical protein GCM10009528_35960 [Kineococcus aurantiacus]
MPLSSPPTACTTAPAAGTGSTPESTASRAVWWALYRAAREGVPTLADKACTGAGAGIRVPVRRPAGGQVLDCSTRGSNDYVNAEGAFVEHGVAHLKTRWRAVGHVSLCP